MSLLGGEGEKWTMSKKAQGLDRCPNVGVEEEVRPLVQVGFTGLRDKGQLSGRQTLSWTRKRRYDLGPNPASYPSNPITI